MLALVAAPGSPDRVELRDVPEPEPLSGDAMVEVRAFSLNRGEMNRTFQAEDGWRPGWDVAGVVLQAAPDGSGPPAGTRVVGLTIGGWAQRVAMPTNRLAPLPGDLSFELASTLPVAGLTALRALRIGGLALGRRVLITGAAGGVGRFAVQLAHRAGAHVTAVVGNAERGRGLADLGADETVHEIGDDGDPYHVILESVGGPSLGAALRAVAYGGTVVTFGNSARTETTFNVSDFYNKDARLTGFLILAKDQPAFEPDLSYLAALVARGELDTQIDFQGHWRDTPSALRALHERKILGKAVLRVE
ncbi:MAG: zinc-binding dehydrogenase [Chloroflexota bacterium]